VYERDVQKLMSAHHLEELTLEPGRYCKESAMCNTKVEPLSAPGVEGV
jgi:hypothetical protein